MEPKELLPSALRADAAPKRSRQLEAAFADAYGFDDGEADRVLAAARRWAKAERNVNDPDAYLLGAIERSNGGSNTIFVLANRYDWLGDVPKH